MIVLTPAVIDNQVACLLMVCCFTTIVIFEIERVFLTFETPIDKLALLAKCK